MDHYEMCDVRQGVSPARSIRNALWSLKRELLAVPGEAGPRYGGEMGGTRKENKMTFEEIEAMNSWMKDRPLVPHVCCYAGLKSAPVDTKEKTYTCVHGKRLTWTDARRGLGMVP